MHDPETSGGQPAAAGKGSSQAGSQQVGFALLVIVGAVFLAFLRVLGNGFVNWDDGDNIVANQAFRGLSPSHLKWMFTTFHLGHYQPLSWVSLAIDYQVWKLNPAGYHLTNLLLHVLNTALFFFLARALLGEVPSLRARRATPSFIASCALGALFFGLHPLRVECVAWATERRVLLATTFALLSVLSFLRASAARRIPAGGWSHLSLLFFTCSLLSAAWAITLPLLLLSLEAYPLRRFSGSKGTSAEVLRSVREKWPYFLIAVLFSVLAGLAQARSGALMESAGYGPLHRMMQSALGLCFYLWKTVVPVGLSPLYYLRLPFNPLGLRFVFSALLDLGITAVLLVMRRRWPWALSAWVAYALILSPVLGLAQSGPQLAADRYSYLAAFPLALLLAAGLAMVSVPISAGSRTGTRRVLPLALGAGIVLLLAGLTWIQTGVWRNGYTLWNRVLQFDPENPIALNNRGCLRKDDGDLIRALADLNEAIRLNPASLEAHNNRGAVLAAGGDLAGAEADFSLILESQKNRQVLVNRAEVREKLGHVGGAESDWSEVLGMNPDDAVAHYRRGLLRAQGNNPTGAREDYDAAVRLDPRLANAFNSRGVLRRQSGDLPGARQDFDTAVRLDSLLADAFYNRGNLLAMQGDIPGALRDFDTAIARNPHYTEAFVNRGSLLARENRLVEARSSLDRALQLSPGSLEALVSRGAVLQKLGDNAGAVKDFESVLAQAPAGWPYRDAVSKALEQVRGR